MNEQQEKKLDKCLDIATRVDERTKLMKDAHDKHVTRLDGRIDSTNRRVGKISATVGTITSAVVAALGAAFKGQTGG